MKFLEKIKNAKIKTLIVTATATLTAAAVLTGSIVYADKDYTPSHAEQVITIENVADSGLFLETPIKGTMQLTKVDAEYPENKLTGAEFEVFYDVDKDGKYNADVDTLYERKPAETETGVYQLKDMRYGYYLVHETKAPEGFYLDKAYHGFRIENDGEVVIVENEAGKGYVNEPIKGTIKLIKVDAENKDVLLSGAEFTVYNDVDGDGKYNADVDTVAGKMTETEKGTYELAGQRYGKYLVNETKAPEGFLRDTNYYPASVVGVGD